jgi:hypothetical protein
VAKQSQLTAQSNCEMQLSAYHNDGVRYLAASTALASCGEENHLTTPVPHLPENGFQALLK